MRSGGEGGGFIWLTVFQSTAYHGEARMRSETASPHHIHSQEQREMNADRLLALFTL